MGQFFALRCWGGNNYNIIYQGELLTITARPVVVTPDPNQYKIFGDIDPVLTYTYDESDLLGDDEFTGELGRAEGEDVGIYDIEIGTLHADNYEISLDPEEFIIYAQLIVEVNDPLMGDAEVVNGDMIDGMHLYLTGDNVSLEATPMPGYVFVDWTIDGVFESDEAEFDFTIPGNNVTITANFEADIQLYTLTLVADPVEGGTVAGEGSYEAGTIVSVEAIADEAEGWSFINWTDEDSNVVSTLAEFDYEMPEADITLTANFTQGVLYTVTADIVPELSGTVTGVGSYLEGDNVVLTAIPNEGFEFLHWEDEDGVELETAETYEFVMPEDDVHVIAVFEALPTFDVIVTIVPEDAGTVTGEGDYFEGANVVLTAEAEEGFDFVGWEREGAIVEAAEVYEFVMPDADVELIAHFAPIVTLTLVANPEIGGEVFGAGEYAAGTVATIEAVAEENWAFLNWTDEDDNIISTLAEYEYEMPDFDVTLTANFTDDDVYVVTADINPEDAGIVLGVGNYLEAADVVLEAIANEGFVFMHWEDADGVELETEAVYNFVMPADDVHVVAVFEPVYELTAEINPEGAGIVTGEGWYLLDEEVTLEAIANEGYSFVNWTVYVDDIDNGEGGDKEGVTVVDNPYTFDMPDANVHVVANFEINVHTLTLVADPEEGGTVAGGGDYEYGTSVTVTATPAAGYTFLNWTIDGSVVSSSASFDYVMPDNDVTLVANFDELPPQTYTLTLIAVPEEGGTVSGGGEYEEGQQVTVVANPADGWEFEGWFWADELVSSNEEFVFNMPGENVILEGRFDDDVSVTDPEMLSITMYPNPTSGNLNITSGKVITEIMIFDMAGKVVYTMKPESEIVEMSLTGVEPGMYFVRIFTQDGHSIQKLQITR